MAALKKRCRWQADFDLAGAALGDLAVEDGEGRAGRFVGGGQPGNRLGDEGFQIVETDGRPAADVGLCREICCADLEAAGAVAARAHRRRVELAAQVEDDALPLALAGLEVRLVGVQVVAPGRLGQLEERLDPGQRHVDGAQQTNDLGVVDLFEAVGAVAGGRVDGGGRQQPVLVVETERLEREAGEGGELTDRHQWIVGSG